MRAAQRLLLALVVFAVAFLVTGAAQAWIENRVLGDEITIEVGKDGKAVVQHRISFHTNGNVRFRKYSLVGVDGDAVPLPNSYVVPAREALESSLDSATPLTLTLVPGKPSEGPGHDAAPPRLDIEVADEKGIRRGKYLLVIRYQTDLLASGKVTRDGAFTQVSWNGPIFEDGFDNARTTFIVPRAPTPPRIPDTNAPDSASNEDRDDAEGTYLAEVRRGESADEIELLRTYTPQGESVPWTIRMDPRALNAAPPGDDVPTSAPDSRAPTPHAQQPVPRNRTTAFGAAALFVFCLLLAGLKAREVQRLAHEAAAEMPPLLPLPAWLRAPLSAALLVAGLAAQLVFDETLGGACLVVGAALFTIYRPARMEPHAAMRGPGRWLAVSEREAFDKLPRPTGGWLDFSTIRGKLGLLLLVSALGVAVWQLFALSMWHAVVVGADVVYLLAIFGTGMGKALPPDMTVEPARFFRQVTRRLRKRKDLGGVRIVPRIRIPTGGVDPDEVRLLIAPRVPLRGFTSIEIGVTYAIGMGARVAMPEILLRVVADSPCEDAIKAVSRLGRVAPGRKRDERVISFSPRFPTARMTAEIAAAVAVRVLDRSAGAQAKRPRSHAGASTSKHAA